MCGFGGQRPWDDVSTTLTPLLHHPDDDGPDLTPAPCAVLLPRLKEIANQWPDGSSDPVLQRHRDLREHRGRGLAGLEDRPTKPWNSGQWLYPNVAESDLVAVVLEADRSGGRGLGSA
ncbi:hypothetical protein GCM10010344_02240 [Streptomyces bluensis]|nr:hypothetical protein GCM10010344_02240 [Streptomyces bluensis]